jgi:hypothetical protein
LEAFFRAGQASLKKDADRMTYGTGKAFARKVSLHRQTLTDARQFARRVGSFSKFEKLITHAKRHNTRFGMTFCIRLLAAEDRDWYPLIEEAGRREWSSKQLAREIRQRYRRRAKRPKQRLGRPTGAYGKSHVYLTALADCCHRCEKMLDRGRSGKVKALPAELKIDAQTLSRSLAKFHRRLNEVAVVKP